MKIALVDDEKAELKRLYSYMTASLSNDCSVSCFNSGTEFLKSWKSGAFDIIILDIYMDEMLGIDVAKKIRETDRDVCLAFCTTSNDFAGESYEVNAKYYLRKPFSESKVKHMLDRMNIDQLELTRTVTLPDGSNVILRDIIYAEYAGRDITVHCKRSGDTVCRMLLSEAEKLFCGYSFFCICSKGIIVNLYEVANLSGDILNMKCGLALPVSRRKLKEVTEAYATLRFEMLRKGGEAN